MEIRPTVFESHNRHQRRAYSILGSCYDRLTMEVDNTHSKIDRFHACQKPASEGSDADTICVDVWKLMLFRRSQIPRERNNRGHLASETGGRTSAVRKYLRLSFSRRRLGVRFWWVSVKTVFLLFNNNIQAQPHSDKILLIFHR